MSILSKLFGDPNAKRIEQIQTHLTGVGSWEQEYQALSDDDLKTKTAEFKERWQKDGDLDALLPEAFALTREASRRIIGQRHYDCQLIGGYALHLGQIAEMKTGEGKTLTATAPVYLNALTGKGVHVVTVNDYLAKRDAVWMGQVYHALGLTVASIQHDAAFKYDPEYRVTAPADPRSQSDPDSVAHRGAALTVAPRPQDDPDSIAHRGAQPKISADFLRPISRREAYACDITYGTNNEFGFDYLRDNMAHMPEQKVQRPLYYAIVDEVDSILIDEARTPLIISAPAAESTDKYKQFAQLVTQLQETADYTIDEKQRAASLTEAGIEKIEKALGMGNIYTEGGMELVHHLEQALKAQALFKKDRDYVVKDDEVIIIDEFTGRFMEGRRYSEGLHQAIEAKENVDIKQESITMATISFQNYFRMYEKLAGMTGTASTSAEEFFKVYKLEVVVIPTNKPLIRKFLPDKIFKTENGKFSALIQEIKARHATGQPILIGTISIEKNEYLGALLEREGVPFKLLNAKNHEKEAEIIAQAGRLGAVTMATNMAGRGVDIILGGLPADPAEQEKVKKLGGLCVLGTERHEARRIDDQLRGRTGRQGDPGEAQFFVSLEDDLMRVFGGDRIKGMMETLKFPEDMPLENPMLSRALDAAQKKVEDYYFDTRKHLLEYDDVMNKQRQMIYQRRDEILNAGAIKPASAQIAEQDGAPASAPAQTLEQNFSGEGSNRQRILDMVSQEISQLVALNTAGESWRDWDIKEIFEGARAIFPPGSTPDWDPQTWIEKMTAAGHGEAIRDELENFLREQALSAYDQLVENIGNPQLMAEIERSILLHSLDSFWIDHLEAMNYLKGGIGLRGYGQRDPLTEYKKEALLMFNSLISSIRDQVVHNIYKVGLAKDALNQNQNAALSAGQPQKLNYSAPVKEGSANGILAVTGQGNTQNQGAGQSSAEVIPAKQRDASGKIVGRNDPCPCGSGKKYKKCCGR